MSTGLPNSIVTQNILILYNIIRLSPICVVRKTFLLLNTWWHARLGLLDFWSFLFQLPQIFWNISTPFLDVLFVFWTFYIRSMSSCCWFFWYQIAQNILNYFLKITHSCQYQATPLHDLQQTEILLSITKIGWILDLQ